MTLKKKMDSDENRRYWEYVERTAREVEETFPDWKKGGEKTNSTDSQSETRRLDGNSNNGNGFHFS